MGSIQFEGITRLICRIAAVGLLVFFVGRAKILSETEGQRAKAWRQVSVKVPDGAPEISQESVDLALRLFNIDVPPSADYPVLNTRLEDRGMSTRLNWRRKIRVEVGPSAFSSWGILGSTLAHELEIHCRQNFVLINIMDSLGLEGTTWAERQAYLYEIKQAQRFGLTNYQRDLIASTMAYYYDIDQHAAKSAVSARVGKTLGQWFARSSILERLPDRR